MRFDIITSFPDAFESYFESSILGRARRKKFIDIRAHDLRRWTKDRHKTVDDRPYGGGPGMVLKIEPIYRAVGSILRNPKHQTPNTKWFDKLTIPREAERQTSKPRPQKGKARIILFSAKGKVMTQKDVKRWSKYQRLILICGHYEGVDERVARYIADEEVSIGEYVLTGGEVPAMALVDAVSRLIPGVLGKKASLQEESFSKPGYREYPQYTRPEIFYPGGKKLHPKPYALNPKHWRVPKVLLSGDHKKIEEWRIKNSKLKPQSSEPQRKS